MLGFGPVTGPTLKTALCHIRMLVGRRINIGTFFAALLCVLWWGALDRLWLRAAQFVRVCSTTGYITSGLREPSPQALTLFGGVVFIARRLRRPEKGNADGVRGIFGTACRVGLHPCDRTRLKNGLVLHSYAGGAYDKYRHVLCGAHMRKGILRYSWLHSPHRHFYW